MATGDDAVAAGMDIIDPATGLVKDGATEINKTRDYIAQKTSNVQPVAKGGTGATDAAGARSNLGLGTVAVENVVPVAKGGTGATNAATARGLLGLGTVAVENVVPVAKGGTGATNAATARGLLGIAADVIPVYDTNVQAALTNVFQGNFFEQPYNRNITWTRRAAWLGDNGKLGYASSSRRHKQDIAPFDITDAQVEALQVVTYRYIAQVAAKGNDAATEVGLLAEDLEEAGLGWALFYDDEGRPEGINYELIALALIPYVHRLSARVTALENEG